MNFILEVLLKILLLPILLEATSKNSCLNGYFKDSESKCLPCQIENVVYFGNNLEVRFFFFYQIALLPKKFYTESLVWEKLICGLFSRVVERVVKTY